MALIPVSLAGRVARRPPPILTTPHTDDLLASGAAVAIGVSGGKDSAILALTTIDYLDASGHKGPRCLIHSHLGDLVEWTSSRDECARLAARLTLDLVVVDPPRTLDDRFYNRWERNLARYRDLACVRLILPWSTPSMKFCTSEAKAAPISSTLVKRYPHQTIISAIGIRGEESSGRAGRGILESEARLTSKTHGTHGFNWHPIRDYTIHDVLDGLVFYGMRLHEAYETFGSPRVSCALCILAGEMGHRAALRDPRNHALYMRYVRLEALSTFAFQGDRWLGDLAPDLLPADLRAAHADAKRRAALRIAAEARIPAHLLYAKGGWPTKMPTLDKDAHIGGGGVAGRGARRGRRDYGPRSVRAHGRADTRAIRCPAP